jgi:hypothetical protein
VGRKSPTFISGSGRDDIFHSPWIPMSAHAGKFHPAFMPGGGHAVVLSAAGQPGRGRAAVLSMTGSPGKGHAAVFSTSGYPGQGRAPVLSASGQPGRGHAVSLSTSGYPGRGRAAVLTTSGYKSWEEFAISLGKTQKACAGDASFGPVGHPAQAPAAPCSRWAGFSNPANPAGKDAGLQTPPTTEVRLRPRPRRRSSCVAPRAIQDLKKNTRNFPSLGKNQPEISRPWTTQPSHQRLDRGTDTAKATLQRGLTLPCDS